MTDKATFTFSAAAASFLRKDLSKEERLKGAAGVAELPPLERLHLMVYFSNDPDEEVKARARRALRTLPTSFVEEVLADPELHPRILDLLVKFYADRSELVPLLLGHPRLTENAAAFLAGKDAVVAASPKPHAAEAAPEQEAEQEGEEEEIDEEEYQSKFQLSQSMGVSEKIKMALTGDKEWRSLLVKDSNKLVSGAVVKNPRITENEILTIAKSAVQNDEIMRVICSNKEWVKNYQIRKALVENHKTPLPAALRFVGTLTEKDLATLAKSKNVSTVIAAQARRILMGKSNAR